MNQAKNEERPAGTTLEEILGFLRIVEKQSTVENPVGFLLLHNPERGWCFASSFRRNEVEKMAECAPFLKKRYFKEGAAQEEDGTRE